MKVYENIIIQFEFFEQLLFKIVISLEWLK